MKRVELGIDIDAPAGDIWAVLTDPCRFPEWIKGIQFVEILTEGAYGVGTRYRVTAGKAGRTIEWTVEITKLVPERRIEFMYSGDVEGNGGWLIDARVEGDGERVTSFDEFAAPGGWVVRLLSRFWLDNAARASRKESLQRLKETLEDE